MCCLPGLGVEGKQGGTDVFGWSRWIAGVLGCWGAGLLACGAMPCAPIHSSAHSGMQALRVVRSLRSERATTDGTDYGTDCYGWSSWCAGVRAHSLIRSFKHAIIEGGVLAALGEGYHGFHGWHGLWHGLLWVV